MCSYQALFHDDNIGYVVRCRECENIQLGFGNLMLTINAEGFDSFREWIKKIMNEQPAFQKETLRSIAIPTPCNSVKLLLSLRELHKLDHMLEEADTELQSSCLLEMFNSPS